MTRNSQPEGSYERRRVRTIPRTILPARDCAICVFILHTATGNIGRREGWAGSGEAAFQRVGDVR